MKKILFFIAIFAFMLSPLALRAQHLFTVIQNDLSLENVAHVKSQIAQSEVSTLSLTKSNENKNVYSISLSSLENRKIVILNEQTGNHVTIIPEEEYRNVFQLAPFFIEELKQGALGNANRYLVLETTADFSVLNVNAVNLSNEAVYIPRFFYGKKENVKEALPKERQIIQINKQKPRLILANDTPELLSYAAQYEEENSYYVYIYLLPDGSFYPYDEHFNPNENGIKGSIVGEQLQFSPTYIGMSAQAITATELAFSIWSEKLSGTIPVDISIESKNLVDPDVIGLSYHMQSFENKASSPDVPTSPLNTWYHSPLWNQLVGYDATSNRDIKLEMNSIFNFFYGSSGNPSSSQTDWITVMLHEICHGLGFSPNVTQDGRYAANGYYQTNPGIFDRQLFQGTSGLCMTDLSQSERAALIISNNLYSGAPGSFLLTAHGGYRVKMHAPTTYKSGSSVSHWNNSPGFVTFMTWSLSKGTKIRNISTREIGILKDLGWTEPDPNAIQINFKPNGGTGYMPAQQYSPGVPQALRENIFTRTGYSFEKWNTKADGTGTFYQDKQTITIDVATDLFAQWKANAYTLSFDANGGTVGVASKEVTYDQAVGALPVPTKPGYKLKAWRVDSKDISDTYVWNYASNKTAIAAWELATYKIVASATPGGKITPKGTYVAVEGESKKYTITPDEGYWIVKVLVDDINVGTDTTYTFVDVKADHTIQAVFSNVGIDDHKNANTIHISPNPTTGKLIIENGELRIDVIDIYDIFGKKCNIPNLTPQTLNLKPQTTIDISHLSNGIYFIKIETVKGTVTKKIIKY